jgi:hypothetical protein
MPIDIKTAFGAERQTRSVLILSAIVLAIYFPFASMISSRVVSTPRPPGKPMRLLKFQKMPEASLPGGGFAYFVRAYSEFEDSDPKAQSRQSCFTKTTGRSAQPTATITTSKRSALEDTPTGRT